MFKAKKVTNLRATVLVKETKEIEVMLTVMDDNNAKYKQKHKKLVNGSLLYKIKYQLTNKINNYYCYDLFFFFNHFRFLS